MVDTAWLDENWEGVIIEYTEQDFPTSKPYKRSVPGWKCKHCGWKFGTADLPPRNHECKQRSEYR